MILPLAKMTEDDNEEDSLQEVLDDLCDELLDEISLGVCFEIHRACRLGTLFLSYSDNKIDRPRAIVDRPGVDVFGHVPTKKQVDCICPNCKRNMAAQRFAPHLEKCMGMGRNSSRIASRRIANNTSSSLSEKRETDDSDDGNDSDWSCYTDKRVKKQKKERSINSPRRHRTRNKNGEFIERVPSPDLTLSYENMSTEEKKSLLLMTCGVISDHTGRMCTKSIKCPQHTDEQRRLVRLQLIGQTSSAESEDIHVDIDGYDDGDGSLLRDTLQLDASSASSPADSSSTTNSTYTKKRPLPRVKPVVSSNKKVKPSSCPNQSSQTSDSAAANQYDFM